MAGALCYVVGALFGPVPMFFVMSFAKDPFTKRCAAQAVCAYVTLLAGALIALILLVGGVTAEVLIHGTGSFNDNTAPPIVRGTSLVAGIVVCGSYAVQVVASVVFARRAARGEVTLFPFGGAAMDRSRPR